MIKITLYVVPSSEYFNEIINIVKNEVKTENLVYVSLGRPYKYIMSRLNEEQIKTNNIFVIDCISKQASPLEEGSEKCIFLESPENITELCIALNQAMKLLQGETTVLFDSLSILLIYNDDDMVGRFSNKIINCMRLNNINSILIVLESDVDRRIVKVIESFVDEVIK